MFTNPSRPRVPSKAALRILYQLAYISSGTAVGVATLCAEERRRRTKIVQRIADNAKRIRSSPRHVHSAAASVVVGGGEMASAVDFGGWDGEEVGREGRMKGRKRREKERDEWALRRAVVLELPSRVKRGYGQTRERNQSLDVENEDATAAAFLETSSANRSATMPENVAGGNTTRGQARSAASRPSGLPRIPRIETTESAPTGPKHDTRRPTQSGMELPKFDTANLGNVAGGKTLGTDASMHRSKTKFDGSPHSHSSSSHFSRSNVRVLSQDITHFLGQRSGDSVEPHVRIERSRKLLRAALRHGTLTEIQSLYRWKCGVAAITHDEVREICEACMELQYRCDHEKLLRFYEDILGSPQFSEMAERVRIFCALLIRSSSISWHLDSYNSYDPGSSLKQDLSRHSAPEIYEGIRQTCRFLSNIARPTVALEMISLLQQHEIPSTERAAELSGTRITLFTQALNLNQLWACGKLLMQRLVNRPPDTKDDECLQLVRLFLQKAQGSQQYAPVTNILANAAACSFMEDALVDLGEPERRCLAISCTKAHTADSDKLWERAYASLDQSNASDVVKARTSAKLLRTWEATRDVTTTTSVYDEVMQWIESNLGKNEPLELDVRLTMVEIFNSANQPEEALRLLRIINRNHAHSSASVTMTALSLGRKGAWKEVQALIDACAKWDKFSIDGEVSRTLNKLLRIYSNQHTATETWNFVTGLFSKLRFKPSLATKIIVMESFVAKQALAMIPRWLRLLKAMRSPFQLHPAAAVRFLATYYHSHRPLSSLVIELSRVLAEKAPSIKTSHLIDDLIKDSIGHDLRKVGQRSKVRYLAEENLARLQQAHGVIPIPIDAYQYHQLVKAQKYSVRETSHHFVMSPQSPVQLAYNGLSVTKELSQPVRDAAYQPFRFSESDKQPPSSQEDATRHNDVTAGEGTPVQVIGPHDDSRSIDENPKRHSSTGPRASDTADVIDEDNRLPFRAVVDPSMDTSGLQCGTGQTIQHTRSISKRTEGTIPKSTDQDRIGQTDAKQLSCDPSAPLKPRGRELAMTGYTISASSPSNKSRNYIKRDERDRERKKQMERDIVFAFSKRKYESVLVLYHRNVAMFGAPSSDIVLQTAVESSLRIRKGDRQEAEAIVSQAQATGMNVTRAVGSLLMHHIWAFETKKHADNINSLKASVVEYYQSAHAIGTPVSLHLGVTAANVLINKGRARSGIQLLNTIYHSSWDVQGLFDIVAFTVYLKGFGEMKSLDGMKWVVKTVLEQNLRIDYEFIDILRLAAEDLKSREAASSVSGKEAARLASAVRRWRHECKARMREQRMEARTIGWRLVDILQRWANAAPSTTVDSALRDRLEEAILGAREKTTHSDATAEELALEQSRRSELALETGFGDQEVQEVIERTRNVLYIPSGAPTKQFSPRRIDDPSWLDQYRLFLQQPLVIDGKRASFRFQLDVDMGDHEMIDEGLSLEDEVTQAQVEASAQDGGV